MESEVNEQFLSFKNDFQLRQPKTPETSEVKFVVFQNLSFMRSNLLFRPANRQINESRLFIARNSVLTDLFQTSHIRSLRNVFVAVLLIFVIQVTINDIIENGR